MAKKKKAKLRIDRVIICALILIAIVVGIVFLVRFLKGKDTKPANVVTTTAIGEEESESRTAEFLDILQKDCSAYVGDSLQLSLEVQPEELKSQVVWSTTNELVLTVDDHGLVHVVGEGTAAVIAVADTFSDSIIIVGISEDVQQTTEYPVANSSDEANASSSATEASSKDENTSMSKQDTTSSEASQPATNPTTNQQDETAKPTQETQTTQPTGTTAEQPSTSGAKETEPVVIEDYEVALNEAAADLGFQEYYSGTYIYREDGNYLGEIIVSEGMTQILLKMRTSSLDNNLKSFLSTALPTSYEAAYSKMLYASTTTTMRLDGLKVRVIVNSDGQESHKQLIIYY